jgi:cysteine-rich repeat protein
VTEAHFMALTFRGSVLCLSAEDEHAMSQIMIEPRRAVAFALALAALVVAGPARAYDPYKSLVPSGQRVGCITCHLTGGGGRACGPEALWPCHNAFGEAFLAAGREWTAALAAIDHDLDGYTSGEELGDPLGSWEVGTADDLAWPVRSPGIGLVSSIHGADMNECDLGLDDCAAGSCRDLLRDTAALRPSYFCVGDDPFERAGDSYGRPLSLFDGQWFALWGDDALPTSMSQLCGGNGPDMWLSLLRNCPEGEIVIQREPFACDDTGLQCQWGLGVFPTESIAPGTQPIDTPYSCRTAGQRADLHLPVVDERLKLRLVASGDPTPRGAVSRQQGRVRASCTPPASTDPSEPLSPLHHPTCLSAAPIIGSSASYELPGSPDPAEIHPDDRCPMSLLSDVWVEAEATCSGRVTVRARSAAQPICDFGPPCHCGPAPRHRVAVYQNLDCQNQGAPDQCSPTADCAAPAEVTFTAARGDRFLIRVGVQSGVQPTRGALEISCEPTSCDEMRSACDPYADCALDDDDALVCACPAGASGDGRRLERGGSACDFEPGCGAAGIDCGPGRCVADRDGGNPRCICPPGYQRGAPPILDCQPVIDSGCSGSYCTNTDETCTYNRNDDAFACVCAPGLSRNLEDSSGCAVYCGDGRKSAVEACDDGNLLAGDGCDSSCLVETSFVCANPNGVHGTSICENTCDNGVADPGEVCPGGGCAVTAIARAGDRAVLAAMLAGLALLNRRRRRPALGSRTGSRGSPASRQALRRF